MISDTKQPGDVLRASDWNAAQEQARRQVTGVVGPGLGYQEGPGGISIAPHPSAKQPWDIRKGILSSTWIPRFGLVHFEGYENNPQEGIDDVLLNVHWPERTGYIQLGISQEAYLQNDVGLFQTDGICPLWYDPASIPAEFVAPSGAPYTNQNLRLGARKDDFRAQYDELGPFLVIGILSGSAVTTTPAIGLYPVHLALVRFLHRRGDCVYTWNQEYLWPDIPEHLRRTPAYVVKFGDGFIVSEVEPGHILIKYDGE